MWDNEPSHSQGNSHLGELESWGILEFSKNNCKGQNPSVWRVFYIIKKKLRHRCLKWACITHLDIWNRSYGQKKGRESNWQFDPRPLKVGNQPNFLVYRWRATYRWKALDEGYNFALDLITIGGLHIKLWAPKLRESELWQFRDSHLGVPRQKSLWMWASWRSTKYTIREGGGLPQVWAVVSLTSPSLPVTRSSTKNAWTMH